MEDGDGGSGILEASSAALNEHSAQKESSKCPQSLGFSPCSPINEDSDKETSEKSVRLETKVNGDCVEGGPLLRQTSSEDISITNSKEFSSSLSELAIKSESQSDTLDTCRTQSSSVKENSANFSVSSPPSTKSLENEVSGSNCTDEPFRISSPKCADPTENSISSPKCTDQPNDNVYSPKCTDQLDDSTSSSKCSDQLDDSMTSPKDTDQYDESMSSIKDIDQVDSTLLNPNYSDQHDVSTTSLKCPDLPDGVVSSQECTNEPDESITNPKCNDQLDDSVSISMCIDQPDISVSPHRASSLESIDQVIEHPDNNTKISSSNNQLYNDKFVINSTVDNNVCSTNEDQNPVCIDQFKDILMSPKNIELPSEDDSSLQCADNFDNISNVEAENSSVSSKPGDLLDSSIGNLNCNVPSPQPMDNTPVPVSIAEPLDTALSPKCSSETQEVTDVFASDSVIETDIPSLQSTEADSSLPTSSTINNDKLEPTTHNHVRIIEESNNSEQVSIQTKLQFPIQYKGFKKKLVDANASKVHKRLNLRSNPFNPTWKKDGKVSKYKIGHSNDKDPNSGSLQTEYAQYLGLQPSVKFKCSNCGMSSFQSMSALNSHQVGCKKFGKIPSSPSILPQVYEHKSTNIKVTRKVFVCSACGTYFDHWNLFLHMQEVHKRYICLYCLGMFSVAEKLGEHLMQKHRVLDQSFHEVEEFKKSWMDKNYFLLCLNCDNIFSQDDDYYSHVCNEEKTSDNTNSESNNKGAEESSSVNPSEKTVPPPIVNNEGKILQKSTGVSNKLSSKRSKLDSNKNGKKSNHSKGASSPVKGDCDEDFSAASFCHVDMADTVPSVTANHINKESPASTNNYKVNSISEENVTIPEKSSENIEIKEEDVQNKETLREEIMEKTEVDPGVKDIVPTETLLKPTPIQSVKRKAVRKPRGISLIRQIKKRKKEELVPKKKKITVKIELPQTQNNEEITDDKVIDTPLELSNSCNEIKNQDKNLPVDNVELSQSSHEIEKNIIKIKLQSDMESDEESDDSQKLSMVVDENASDSEIKKADDEVPNHQKQIVDENVIVEKTKEEVNPTDEIQLAGEDVAAMALTLDDKVDNVKIQSIVKECVRTSCMSCNYCRHAVKIAVNGKQLALHLLSEHRYTPVKNETNDDVVRRFKSCLDELKEMYFNTETYDSSDSSIHIPYDKDNNFDCFQCNYVTNSHRDLYAHKRKSHTKSLLLCIMCKSNFYSYSELLCHLCPGTYNAEIQFQSTDISFRCCFCRLDTIPSAFRLMVHLRKCHHTCDICLEICADQQKLSTHMWKHKLNHLCYRCGIAYASKPDITKHLFWKHGTESVLCKKCLQKKWPHVYHFCIPPTSFICEECNTSFSKAVALKVHKRIHAGDFSNPCTRCEKKFISKKLLLRHEERHDIILQKLEAKLNSKNKSPDEEPKDEIINITDVTGESKDTSTTDVADTSKDSDAKEKCHKRHKKEKEKKSKQVVDVYDLPPLNLSSESDSSDEDELKKNVDITDSGSNKDNTDYSNKDPDNVGIKLAEKNIDTKEKSQIPELNCTAPSEQSKVEECQSFASHELNSTPEPDSLSKLGITEEKELPISENNDLVVAANGTENEVKLPLADSTVSADEPQARIPPEVINNEPVEDIWENFYKTNSQNKNLPYPLCAMKSEIAYGIIMGDHDYCQPSTKTEPVINEDIPTTSNIDLNSLDEKENVGPSSQPLLSPPQLQEVPNVLPLSPKKKQKSQKKKISKNNSSSSSDSSSDSESSSCSCGDNCSCSSSSSNSSSSSSSESDSSSSEGRHKQERRRKKREKKLKLKEGEDNGEQTKENIQPEPEVEIPTIPEDPPIRESELETDETSTDEEFYDRQPQRIANQLLAEKRNQLMLLASVAPVNNGTSSPTPVEETVPETPTPTPPIKLKQKTRRREGRRKVVAKEKHTALPIEKPVSNALVPYIESPSSSIMKQFKLSTETKSSQSISHTSLLDTPGSGSETDSTRLSKRRRIPNKFYGYSSGEEEDKLGPPVKWRKQDLPVQYPKIRHVSPPTPRIQLTVSKGRKQVNMPKPKSESSSDSDSESDIESDPPAPPPPPPPIQKPAVYCYCRCPYDEVSEMIACDDANCKIEWFHFECVGILIPPRGQWYCPECRKRRDLPT